MYVCIYVCAYIYIYILYKYVCMYVCPLSTSQTQRPSCMFVCIYKLYNVHVVNKYVCVFGFCCHLPLTTR